MKDETRQWMGYAEENLRSAAVLLENGLYNPCLQNTQQAIEKMLKAVLIEKSFKIKKTHSIRELLQGLQEIGVEIALSEDETDLIDSLYLPSKYPIGAILPEYEPNKTICRQCLDMAVRVHQAVKEHIR